MASTYYNHNKRSNKLLRFLIIVSIAVHIPMYLYMNNLLSSKVMHYIDLTLQEVKKPFSRGIPRPPMLPKKQTQKDKQTKMVMSTPIQLPDVSKMNIAQGEGGEGLSVAEGAPGYAEGEDYKEMVLRRIEQEKSKHWFKESDGKFREGLVVLSFIINPDGTIRDLKILKPSPYKSLNEAALKAVRNSVPFPKPPANIYKGGLEISPLNLSFELI